MRQLLAAAHDPACAWLCVAVCVQFALLESVVGLSMIMRRYEFELDPTKGPVGMTTGEAPRHATPHQAAHHAMPHTCTARCLPICAAS